MPRTIQRYTLKFISNQIVTAPQDAVFLNAGVHKQQPCLYVMASSFDDDTPVKNYQIAILNNDHKVPDNAKYINTVQVTESATAMHIFLATD